MQSRQKMIVIVASVIIGLLFAGAAFLLVRGFLQFYEVETSLKESKNTLEQLYKRNPFPSQENLGMEKENLRVIEQELIGLQSAMCAEQVEPVGQSPAGFINQFFETQRALLSGAATASIAVTKGFDFSFGRHMTGNLPAPQDVPRLTQQLKIVETLCNILYAAKISKLAGIARQEFEVDAPGATPPKAPTLGRPVEISLKNVTDPMAGIIPTGQQYGRWHFVLQFSGRESSVMNILNGFAKCPVFVIVTRLNVEGDEKLFERKEVAVAKAADDSLVVKEAPKAKDYRVMCGRDTQLNVKLELDVYQFAKPQVADLAKKPGGVK